MIIVLDNYDSFTHNLVQYVKEIGENACVYKSDRLSVADLKKLNPKAIIVSPGPGRPTDAGVSLAAIESLGDSIPIFGVCLGHQCIGQVYGADVVLAREVIHGKTSEVVHDKRGVYAGLEKDRFIATRYHSLIVDKQTIPETLEISSWTESDLGVIDEVMGLRHKTNPVEGVQFHPESILSEFGHELLINFIRTYC
jgi:anthranilate synthase component II